MMVIQELENRQEDRGLGLIMVSMEERSGLRASRRISQNLLL